MAYTIAEAMLEQQRDEARRDVTYARAAIRNALAELEEGEFEAAIETLQQIVGSDKESPDQ